MSAFKVEIYGDENEVRAYANGHEIKDGDHIRTDDGYGNIVNATVIGFENDGRPVAMKDGDPNNMFHVYEVYSRKP